MIVDRPTSTPDTETTEDEPQRKAKDAARVEYLNLVIACAVVAAVLTAWPIIEVVLLTAPGYPPTDPLTRGQAIDIMRALLACASSVCVWVGFFIILVLRRMSATFAVTHSARQHEQALKLRAELLRGLAAYREAARESMDGHLTVLAARDREIAARDREREEGLYALIGAVDALIQTISRDGDERAFTRIQGAVDLLDHRLKVVDNSSLRHRPG
ncbi:hypothetical protein I0C86_30965 [Plantactinospora sp. S1510]|uniref:Uncharacterized protein n=1 Tax=Plantactinospora alkalitolerans TaxID=2789879 RepID=A0ABS0H4T1_9ACTN|nr:hypothetical protein [Plantactinospora alkalitolerans]MBF9133349.1 hypothetical protein [Plantactinospora alkalitolerans]